MGVLFTSAEGETPDCDWTLTLEASLAKSIRRWPSTHSLSEGEASSSLMPWCFLLALAEAMRLSS